MTITGKQSNIQKKERPLFFLERTLVGQGIHPFNGVFAVRLRGTIKPDALEAALLKVQYKYPQLRMVIAEVNSSRPYFFIPTVVAPLTLIYKERSYEDQWQQEVLYGLRHQFNLQSGPMMQVVCLYAEQVNDLILSFHHCICDGGGGVVLIKELLRLLDEPSSDLGHQDKLLYKEDIIPQDILKNKAIQMKTSLLAGVLKTALSMSSVFISSKNKTILDRFDDYLFHLKLDQHTTSKWIKKCKEQQVTVNTALGLLLLQAYKKVMGVDAKNKVSCPVDIRRFAAQIKEDQLFSFGLLLTLSQSKHTHTFWEAAKSLQLSVNQQTKSLRPYEFLMTFEKLHKSLPNMLKMLTYGKVGNDLMFSNIGRIPLKSNYETFELETVFSPTVIGPFANPTTLICSTFNDQLDFSFVSNEGFLPKNKAREIISLLSQGIESRIDTSH